MWLKSLVDVVNQLFSEFKVKQNMCYIIFNAEIMFVMRHADLKKFPYILCQIFVQNINVGADYYYRLSRWICTHRYL